MVKPSLIAVLVFLATLTGLIACSEEATLPPTPTRIEDNLKPGPQAPVSEKAPQIPLTSEIEAQRNDSDAENDQRVQGLNTVVRWPTANVLNPILWLGCPHEGNVVPSGTGVVIHLEDAEYFVTALHVAVLCGMNPLVRFNGKWNAITWETVATSQTDDIAILRTDVTLDDSRIPVRHGMVKGAIYGQIGYALGYPGVRRGNEHETDHIVEFGGRPIPIVALAIANFASTERATYSSSYINAGFSGGAIVFPVGEDDWTIAGIISHFPTIPRPVYRKGKETGDYILQHTGLVGFTPFERIEELIEEARAKAGGARS